MMMFSSASAASKPLCRHQRAHSRGPTRRVAVARAAAPQSRRSDDAPPPPPPSPPSPFRDAARRAAAASAAAVLSASALLGSPVLSAAAAVQTPPPLSTSTTKSTKTTTYRLPVVSPDPEVLSVQRVLLQAWEIVDSAFVDGSFGGRGREAWRGDLVDSLDAAAGAGAAAGGGGGGAQLAELAIDAMLDRLGDQYTRRMPARDYEAFRQSSEGEIAGGVGLLIAAQPVAVVKGDEGQGAPLSSTASSAASSPPSSPSSSSPSSKGGTRPRSRLVVLSPIEGGPAARAGIRPGDEVLAIDGRPTAGLDGGAAAGMLRGPRGSSVVVDVARREVEGEAGVVPGIPGRAPPLRKDPLMVSGGVDGDKRGTGNAAAEAPPLPRVSIRQVRLRREKVELSPVTSTMLVLPEQHQQQKKIGYLRLASFNARAASDTARALGEMRAQGAEAFVLDLRGNGGGLVRAAVDVSRALLPRGATVFAVQGRSDTSAEDGENGGYKGGVQSRRRRLSHHSLGAVTPLASPLDVVGASSGIPTTAITQRVVLDDEQQQQRGPPSSSSSSFDSSLPLTTTPLAVLVDRNSASASEILAGALRDNGRAALVGERTFGKGKIQSVFPLRDGSALFVTIARYVTPTEHLIDGVGIKPENACGAARGGGVGGSSRASSAASTLLASLEMVPGVAHEAGVLEASLMADSCVLTAERLLLAQVEKQEQQEQGRL